MAKISALDVATQLTGDEHLPIVQGPETKRATMAAFRDLITPYLQYWYKGDRGFTGTANNTYTSYSELQASDPTRMYAYLAGDTDVPPRPDGPYSNPTGQAGGWVPQTGRGIAFAQDGLDPLATDLETEVRRFVWAEQFGFSPARSGAQNRASLQRAIDAIYARGGGVLRVGAGVFPIDGFVRWKPGVFLRGSGKKTTTFLQTNVSPQTIRHGYEGIGGGCIGFVGFTIFGRGTPDDLPSFFDEKAINVGRSDDASGPAGADEVLFDDVEIAYSRGMCIGAVAKVIVARNCHLHHGFRDGFNFTGSRLVEVSGNICEKLSDDPIAVHLVSTLRGVVDTEIRIIGNRCERALGIKALGARNTVITNNTLRFCASYSIEVDADSHYGEGVGAKFGVVILGNSILDPIPPATLGYNTGINTFIQVGGTASQGSDPHFQGALEGRYTDEGFIVTPEYAWLNWNDPGRPRPANRSIIVANNTLHSTLPPALVGTPFSNYGFGTLWNTAGDADPISFPGTIRGARGIQLDGDFRNVIITGNTVDGADTAVTLSGRTILDGIMIHGNNVTRSRNGVAVDNWAAPAEIHGLISIENNRFDLDPYCELPGHDPNSGQWVDYGPAFGFVFLANKHKGIVARRNTFSNARQIVIGDSSGLSIEDNDLHWDWRTPGGARGIGDAEYWMASNRNFFRNSNPTDPSFGRFSSPPDSEFVKRADVMPWSGYFVPGQFVPKRLVTVESGRLLIGWRRLTLGNAHQLGVDWFPVYQWDGTHPEAPPPSGSPVP